jgi:thiamine-phosphate pyrophosphorylase
MVTDRRRYGGTGEQRFFQAVRNAASAGVDVIQLRERGLEDGALLALARGAIDAAGGARTLINNRLDVAMAAGADGVHLPSDAASSARIRAAAPAGFIVGRSVHSEDEARAAEGEGGCDYLLFGSVFESASKPHGHTVAGLDALARVCASVRLPVVAIGGMTADRAADVARAGAAGVAGIDLFAKGERDLVAEAVRLVRRAFEQTGAPGRQ